jgi:hypothetical protein
MNTTQELSKFLQVTTGQKEAALIITADDQQLADVEASLIHAGFTKALKPLLFLKSIHFSEHAYIVLTEDNAKAVYDICLQYPTGQISGFNSSKMKSLWVTPNYAKTAIMVITTVDLLKKLENAGLPLRSVAGLTFQV